MDQLSKRILSIDILRGLVMVLMALDHVRDYFHIQAMTGNPMDYETSTLPLYFTRWITHYCAPIFVFLSGISAYLSSLKKSKKETLVFLIKRGLFLLLMEVTVVCFGWTFNPFFNMLVLQVIWAIGISMIVLGLVSAFPRNFILGLSILIICGHNIIDRYEPMDVRQLGFIWDALHHGGFSYYPFAEGHGVLVVYPVIPWIGIMLLGYSFGPIYKNDFDINKRKRILLYSAAGMIFSFFILRVFHLYGDPHVWKEQNDISKTIMDFLDVSKYPPSLIFTCMTLGPACLFLALTETSRNYFSRYMTVFGRVAFFYYIVHIYCIHLLCLILFYASGYGSENIVSAHSFFNFRPPEMGFELPIVWIIWIGVIILLYFPCKWYYNFKLGKKSWIYKYI